PMRLVAVRTIDRIQTVRKQANQQISRIVTLQERAANPLLLISQVQDEVVQAERGYQARLAVRDAEPVWKTTPTDVADEAVALASRSLRQNTKMITEFTQARAVTVFVGVISLAMLLIFLYRMRQRMTHAGSPARTTVPDARVAIEHPLAVAFILQLPFGLAL